MIDRTTPMLGIEPGDVLLGKYRVEGFLGKGGMGNVVAARHIDLDELFAIKLLRPRLAGERRTVQRFMREARAAAKLRSPHVTRVYDVGKLANGVPYMVMEHLEGSDLRGLLERWSSLPPSHVARLVLQACDGIAAAHALGIVHRDLKLANLFLARQHDGEPCLKVLDFGISKHANAEEALTHPGALIGSPRYMSPEQFRDPRDVDARSDVWGLGVIFYQLVTGQVPFNGSSLTTLLSNVLTVAPPPPSTLREGVPASVDALVMRCLAKRREDRFEDIEALATAIDRLALDDDGSLGVYLEPTKLSESEPGTGAETETIDKDSTKAKTPQKPGSSTSNTSPERLATQPLAAALDDLRARGILTSSTVSPLDLPGGVVRSSSYFYVTRGEIEDRCLEKILEPGALLRIEGPQRVGKTSLMRRLLDHAREAGMRVVHVDLRALEDGLDLDFALRWLCQVVGRRLGLARITEEWDEVLGARSNCTVLFEDRFLGDGPLVLALNHFDRLFDNHEVAEQFSTMLRAWHEMAKSRPLWERLRLILVHSGEIYRPMDVDHSPFEVGFTASLGDWTTPTILELAHRHGLSWGEDEVARLRRVLGGHPHLARVALHYIATHQVELDEFLANAVSDQGPFAAHLNQVLWELREQPTLREAALALMASDTPIELEAEQRAQLVSLGVARREGDAVVAACVLYRRYLRPRLSSDEG
jgi:serine/threonine protein kinase